MQSGHWSQVGELAATDAGPYDGFGWTVAISGDGHEILVGAPFADNGTIVDIGAAYFFRDTGGTWAQVAKVRAADSVAYDGFGWAVGLSRDGLDAIVGATGHDVGALKDAGSAYVFHGDPNSAVWTQVAALTSRTPRALGEFGGATGLSANGSTAVVTELTHLDSTKGLHTGGTVIFGSADGWKTSRVLAAFTDPNHNSNEDTDAYGVNAVLSDDGTTAAIAAPDVNVGTSGGAGATFVYSTKTNWAAPDVATTLSLFPSDPHPFLYYGSSVALSADGSRLFIGIDGAGSNDQGAGEYVRLARGAAGTLKVTARTPIAAPNTTVGRFGTAIALSADGTTGIGTAPWLTVGGAKTRGGAYVLPFPKK